MLGVGNGGLQRRGCFEAPVPTAGGLTGMSMGHGVSGVQLHRCLNPAVTQEPCLFDGEATDLPSDGNIRSFFTGHRSCKKHPKGTNSQ